MQEPNFEPPAEKQPNTPNVRMFITAWVSLTLVVGLGTFATLFWALGGMDVPATAPTAMPEVAAAAAADATAAAEPQQVTPDVLPLIEPIAPTAIPEVTPTLAPVAEVFGLGGQVIHGGLLAQDKMHNIGMTWAKLQAYDITQDFTPDIENAHRNNFRILLSVKDNANHMRVTDPDYQEQLLKFLEGLATKGADAIEVWNEPNLSREWPPNKMGGAYYTELLKKAYTRIKAANPNTLVISAALSPTGAFNGGCGSIGDVLGCDDKPFLEKMVASGALDYLDCVGIHYNEGLLPPSATSGDPRGNSQHYTRYFKGMLDTYLGILGGTKPLCFTELGYLSGEEWGTLPANFRWNPPINMKVAQQAEYLGAAVKLARSSGNIRMIIVFNMDFAVLKKDLADDPQAGYSIIRPNESCPACDTLRAAMQPG